MDLEIIIVSEVSQKKTNIISAYMQNLKKKVIQINLLTKSKQTQRFREITYGYWGKWK